MGSVNKTPNIDLPLFGDNDKPSWRGDINGAMTIIDENIGDLNENVDELLTDVSSLNVKIDERATISSSKTIVTYGDSLTEAGHGGGDTWQEVLADETGLTFVNRGVSGEESGAVAFRQGGVQLTATNGFTINANSLAAIPVSVTTDRITNMNVNSHLVTIKGAQGTLTSSNGFSTVAGPIATVDWTFTPSVGSPSNVVVPSGEQFVAPNAVLDAGATQILWVGRNDIAFGFPNIVDGTVDAVQGMVKHLNNNVDLPRFMVISAIKTDQYDNPLNDGVPADNEPWIDGINALLGQIYPSNFVDLQAYILANATAIANSAGIVLSPADNVAIEQGFIPTGFTTDGIHLNPGVRRYGVAAAIAKALDNVRTGLGAQENQWFNVPLQNGWLPSPSLAVTSKDGIGYLNGEITGGSVAEGTVIGRVPEAFYPGRTQKYPAFTNNNGSYVPNVTQVTVSTSGEIIIGADAKSWKIVIDAHFPLWA